MKKKLTLTALLCCLALACVGAGCKELSKVEEKEKEGYTISVSYDANGGLFLNRPGVTVMDMFNPSNYEKDSNGTVHIKLLEPTDPSRPTSVQGGTISLALQNHFFAGWYKNREVKTVGGKPVDEAGRELTLLEDGSYVYTNTLNEEKPTKATPAYNYSGYWDFENDRLEYTEGVDETISLTLYAGWVPYYEFNYYYQVEGEWQKLDTATIFDYKTTNMVETEADQDTIFLPQWTEEGNMSYEHKYLNSTVQKFPSIEGTTFEKAYMDAACTQEITTSLEHSGSLEVAHGEEKALLVQNRIQNVYLVVSEGEQYRIKKAEHFVNHPNLNGYYEIEGDLDFTNLTWPTTFSVGEFKGKIYGKDGAAVTFSNINVDYSATAKAGGLFGKISKDASMQGITFSNVTLNLINTGSRNSEASYGLFAGVIETGASLDVTITQATLKIGTIGKAEELAFHTVANGDRTGITADAVKLIVYGFFLYEDEEKGSQYEYTVKPETVKVEADGTITFEFYPSSELLNQEKVEIQ